MPDEILLECLVVVRLLEGLIEDMDLVSLLMASTSYRSSLSAQMPCKELHVSRIFRLKLRLTCCALFGLPSVSQLSRMREATCPASCTGSESVVKAGMV